MSGFDSALEDHVVKGGWVVEKPSRVVARWVAKGLGDRRRWRGDPARREPARLWAGGDRRRGHRGWRRHHVVRAEHAARHDAGRHGPRDARRVPSHPPEDHGAVPLDAAGGRQRGPGMARDARPGRGVGHGARPAGGHRGVLQRSLEDVREQPQLASATYFPAWYRTSDGSSVAGGLAAGSGGSIFSGSAVPDLGGMMSALGTIGNSPASSGSGGGRFGGGSSGGGGGGAGGGF